MSAPSRSTPDLAVMLAETVYTGGGYKPFGQLSADDVRARAAELREAVGFGPTARIAPVARAWADLSRRMETAGAAKVADLDGITIAELSEPLWIVPPGGSLLR